MAEKMMILNTGPTPETGPVDDVAERLLRDLQQLKSEMFVSGKGQADYTSTSESEAFRQFVADTPLLKGYDLNLLRTREERLAFWVNIFNTLVIHGMGEFRIRESVREVPDFFSRFGYRIGDLSFTPDDIEHGILRGNRRPPHGLFHPFAAGDGRRSHVIDPPDPRIHFALFRTGISSPLFNVYAPERIEEQLDVAASGFINGPEVEILPGERLLRLSPLLKWYQSDFGGYEGVIDTLIRYLDHGEAKDFLIEQGLAADVEWKEFDRRLKP